MMRFTNITAILFLVILFEMAIANQHCMPKRCTKMGGCPNTFKCVKKEKCCQFNLPEDCDWYNDTSGFPQKCRGGRSQPCIAGYVCKMDSLNRWSVCCKEAVCHDDLGNVRRKSQGEWTESDSCTKCTCESSNNKDCNSDGCTNCQKIGDSSSFSPCPANICGKQVRIRRCDSKLNKRISNDPPSFNDVEQELKTCYPPPTSNVLCPQPGIALTEKSAIIIGGEEVYPEHNFGWMVHIYDLPGECRCGGTILSQRHILTAAHCFDFGAGRVTLKTGKHRLSVYEPLEQTRYVTRSNFMIHEEYRYGNTDNDIAILYIDPPLEFNKHTQPIKLPMGKFDDKQTRKNLRRGLCKVIGWGDIEGNYRGKTCRTFIYSDVLLETQINFPKKCDLSETYNKLVTDNMFCAHGVNKDSCVGDSGGPFMCRVGTTWYQHGIVSWGPAGSCGKASGVYTKVSNYVDWINDKISTDGGWGEWSGFTSCSASCGDGIKTRVRVCTNPEPIANGKCPGYNYKTTGGDMLKIEEQLCNMGPC